MAESWRRFIALDNSIEDFIQEQQNKHTRAKTRRDVCLLIEFLKQKEETRKVEEIKSDKLNNYLCEHISSVK